MTSKEFLIKQIESGFTLQIKQESIKTNEFKDITNEMWKQVLKDLEVLEILKHLIPSIEKTFNLKQFHKSGMLGTHIKDYFIDNDITGKVKEWLER